jgi:flavorubredoxin
MKTTIDHVTRGIYRIATLLPGAEITFNQFLIDDERPALVHTGQHALYENVRDAIAQVLDPARLAHIILLHWEGDENGGMDRFMAEAPQAELAGSTLSIRLNATGFGVHERVRGFADGERLELGRHTLLFRETPHVHHWDSMMLFEESSRSLFPSDLFLQPGDQPSVVSENLSAEMCDHYRRVGIFAHEQPVREVVERLLPLDPQWVFAMHGGTLTSESLPPYVRALREREFGYCGMLLGREPSAVPEHPATARS